MRIVEGVRGAVDARGAVAPRFDYGAVAPVDARRTAASTFSRDRRRRRPARAGATALERRRRSRLAGARHGRARGERLRLRSRRARPASSTARRPEALDAGRVDAALERDDRLVARVVAQRVARRDARTRGRRALGARAQGAHLRAHRRDRGRADHLAARDASAARATGTTASAGSATRHFTARSLAELGCDDEADALPALRRAQRRRARRRPADPATASAASGASPRWSSTSRATAVAARCASATAPRASSSSTPTASSSTSRWQLARARPLARRRLLALPRRASSTRAAERWQRARPRDLGVARRARATSCTRRRCAGSALDRGHPPRRGIAARGTARALARGPRRDPRRRSRRAATTSERGMFVQAFGDDGPRRGAAAAARVSASSTGTTSAWCAPRTRSRGSSTTDGLLRRYDADDGLPAARAPSCACSFWLASASRDQGRSTRRGSVFDRAAATRNDLGLFSEEFDPAAESSARQLPPGADPPLAHRRRARARPGSRVEDG